VLTNCSTKYKKKYIKHHYVASVLHRSDYQEPFGLILLEEKTLDSLRSLSKV